MFNTEPGNVSPVEEYQPGEHESLPHPRSRLPRVYAAFFCPALTFAHLAL